MNVNRGVVEKQNTGSEKLPGMNFKKTKERGKAPARSPVRSLCLHSLNSRDLKRLVYL